MLQEANNGAEIGLLTSYTREEPELDAPHAAASEQQMVLQVAGREEVLSVISSIAVHSHEEDAFEALTRASIAKAKATVAREPLFLQADLPQVMAVEELRGQSIRAELDPYESDASPETV
jgi:hypothetical protein